MNLHLGFIDWVVLGVLGIAGFWGWRRGTLVMALSLGGMVAGYVGAFLLFKPVGTILIGATSMPPMLAYPLASLALWFLIGTLAGVLQSRAMKNRKAQRKEGWTPSSADGGGGAALGVAWAVGLVGIVLWAMMGAHSFTGHGPDVETTTSAQITSALAERVVRAIAEKVTQEEVLSSAMAIVASSPAEGTQTLKTVLQDERFVLLLSNSTTRAQLAAGDVASVSGYPAIQELASDSMFLAAAARLSLVGDGVGVPPAEALVEGIAPMAQSLDLLLADEQIRALVQQSDLIERIKNGDMGSLVTDPLFNELASRVLALLREVRP